MRPETPILRLERPDLMPEKPDLRPERPDLRPERPDLRPERPNWGDELMNKRKSPCVLQDFVPFRAAALLPFNLNQTLLKQGTGTADHLLPLAAILHV